MSYSLHPMLDDAFCTELNGFVCMVREGLLLTRDGYHGSGVNPTDLMRVTLFFFFFQQRGAVSTRTLVASLQPDTFCFMFMCKFSLHCYMVVLLYLFKNRQVQNNKLYGIKNDNILHYKWLQLVF